MQRRFERLSRTVRSGIGFAIFGIMSVLLTLTVAPLVRVFSSNAEEREMRTQWLVHRAFRFFLRIVEGLGVARIRVEGAERLAAPGSLVVANHPTLIDVIALIAHMPQADCIVKEQAFRNPLLRGMVMGAGYLPNTGGQALVDACSERLRAGRSLVLFPEGTRSPRGGLGTFQRGAAHIALATGCDLLPAMITCDPPTLMKGQHWYDVPERPFHLEVRVGEPLSAKEFGVGVSRLRASRTLTASLREEFEKRMDRARS
jgi:1-acyl-sn-glycerol-3-phosphate acyltransferase